MSKREAEKFVREVWAAKDELEAQSGHKVRVLRGTRNQDPGGTNATLPTVCRQCLKASMMIGALVIYMS